MGFSACTNGVGTVPAPLGQAAAALRLVTYDSCEDALHQFKQAAARYVSANGIGDTAPFEGRARSAEGADVAGRAQATGAPVSARDYATTNTHEAGVDEPDLVKTDGRRIVTVVNGTLRVIDVESKKLVGELTFDDTRDGRWYPSQLLMAGDRALILGQGSIDVAESSAPVGADVAVPAPAGPWPGGRLVLVDLSGEPRTVSTLDLDGSYVDARQVGSVARIVVRSTPRLPWSYPWDLQSASDLVGADRDDRAYEDRALDANREVLARSTIDDWLPHYVRTEDGKTAEGRLVKCADIRHPPLYSANSMLTVVTVDLADGLRTDDSVGIVADGQTVYGTKSSLYVADDHREMIMPIDTPPRAALQAAEQSTEIHKFDLSGEGKPEYVASGLVDGWLLNQYSLSEYDGHLRVATVRDRSAMRSSPDVPATESQVTILAKRGDRLTTVGKVGGLGRGEQIYAVRFMGPVGYVVTFRQIDPLYVLDLSDPIAPQAVGELKMPGYSSYLHPVGDGGRLIGVGQNADQQGVVRGTQVSLFDVNKPAEPARLDTFTVPGTRSDAENDPHAFLYWPDERMLVIPVWYGGWGGASAPEVATPAAAGGALVLHIDGDSLTEVGILTHLRFASRANPDDPTIRRSLVIGDTLWTVSTSGALASDLDDLDVQAWVPFAA